jgi:hypothetical protein
MRQSRNNVFEGLTIQKSRHHGVFMAQTFAETAAGWRPCPGSECAGNSFDDILIAHCGGKGFLINDATCTNNMICRGRFADNAQGELAQASPNLITITDSVARAKPTRLDPATPAVHPPTDHVADIPGAPKTL